MTVTNPDAGTGSANVFTVNAGPTVSSASPSSGNRGASNLNVTITGTGFASGATSAFSGTQITVNSTTFLSATQLTANITISSSATTGLRNLTVTNPDAGTGTATNVFTVNGVPTVTSTSPSSGNQGASNFNVTVNGTSLESGAAASFSGTGITVNSTTFVNSTQLTANITITAGATTGLRNVTVTNPDNTTATGTGVFTVNAGPTVTSTSPSSRGQGASNQTISIVGTGFVSGSGLAASFAATGITVNSTTFVNSTHVNANITITASASTGPGNVTVTNPDNSTATGTGVFTVRRQPRLTPSPGRSLPRPDAAPAGRPLRAADSDCWAMRPRLRCRPDAGARPAPVRSLFRRAGASLRPACALVDRSFPFACASV